MDQQETRMASQYRKTGSWEMKDDNPDKLTTSIYT